MHQLQQESEKLIANLESALLELRKEKAVLTEELEKKSSKLEDTEDSLFDAQQESKKKDKQYSLQMWKSLAAIQRMKIRFQQGMKEFDSEANERLNKVRKQLTGEMQESTLVG